jgi:hypothetical protein
METLNRTIAQIIPQVVFCCETLNKYEVYIKKFIETNYANEYGEPPPHFPILIICRRLRDEFGILLSESKQIADSYRDKHFKRGKA